MTFIEELQSLEEPTKMKVLVVATTILMILVIYFWLIYFNGIVSAGTQASVSGSDQPVATAPPGPGIWGKVGNGTAIVWQSIGSGIEWIGQALQKPREYIIK
jgi:hypothetical protein